MNQAKLYSQANSLQRTDAEEICEEFSSILQWRLDGRDSLLDIGTGSGDVLRDFLYPLMPKGFSKIIGADISSKMVQYCKRTYSDMENVDFRILDVETDTLPKEFINEFDHVTSFYCLHWIRNQRQAVENIYQMIRYGGDCLLVFLAGVTLFNSYNIVALNPKWAPYMKDRSRFISPFQYCEDPQAEFSQILEDAGFDAFSVEVRDKVFYYEDRENMKKNFRAVNPFVDRIPTSMQEEFLDELVKFTLLNTRNCNGVNRSRYPLAYKLIVAYARK